MRGCAQPTAGSSWVEPCAERPLGVIVVGGGIVGLATAYRLLEARPDLRLTLVERESELATHQTGHNSGVLHAGLYYAPGSLKAQLCREAKAELETCRATRPCSNTPLPGVPAARPPLPPGRPRRTGAGLVEAGVRRRPPSIHSGDPRNGPAIRAVRRPRSGRFSRRAAPRRLRVRRARPGRPRAQRPLAGSDELAGHRPAGRGDGARTPGRMMDRSLDTRKGRSVAGPALP